MKRTPLAKKKLFYILSFFVLTFFVQEVYAQPNLLDYDYSKRRFRFGFCLGGNYATFTSVPNPNLNHFDSLMIVEPTGKGGFDIGISINFRLTEYFDLKFVPNLSMLSRSMDYTLKYQGNETFIRYEIIESINVDLPFFVKMKSTRIANNMRFFVLSGGQYSYDMMSNSKKRNAYDMLKLKANDIQVLAGAGMEFYLPYFKLSIEGKMGFGIPNLLSKENDFISLSIEKLHSKTFHLVIILE
jgi:hypothetical protein